jgi:hypothetical protein
MEFLFIGGQQDGKRHHVDGIHVAFPVIHHPAAVSFDYEHAHIEQPHIEVEHYERSKLRGSATEFYIFTLSGMSGDAVIESLLKNYSRQSIDEF